MTSATVNSVTTTFAYRGDGLRDSRTTGANTTTYTWDVAAGLPSLISDGSNSFVWGVGPVSQVTSAGTYYYLEDALGSTVKLVDSSGSEVASYVYDVFGSITSVSGSVSAELTFGNQQIDASTGLLFLQARYYDTTTGSFASRDPLATSAFRTESIFAYAGSNPVMYLDPTGLDKCSWRDPWECMVEGARWVDLRPITEGFACALTGPLTCGGMYRIQRHVDQVVERHYSNSDAKTRNAFRHCYWAGLMTYNYGPVYASLMLSAHEAKPTRQTWSDLLNDAMNNAVGIGLGEYHNGGSPGVMNLLWPELDHAGLIGDCRFLTDSGLLWE
jgi:RHS repeat-associated protein